MTAPTKDDELTFGQPVMYTSEALGTVERGTEHVVVSGDRGRYVGPLPDPGDNPDWHMTTIEHPKFGTLTVPAHRSMFQPATMTYVVTCPNYWGKGETIDAAKRECRKQGGDLTQGWELLTFDELTHFHGIDEMGRYEYTGKAPFVEQHPAKGKSKRS